MVFAADCFVNLIEECQHSCNGDGDFENVSGVSLDEWLDAVDR